MAESNVIRQKWAIPAAQGWFVLLPVKDGEQLHEFWPDPVVAWTITDDPRFGENGAMTLPVTLEGEIEKNVLLLAPDGVVHWPGIQRFNSMQEAFDYFGNDPASLEQIQG